MFIHVFSKKFYCFLNFISTCTNPYIVNKTIFHSNNGLSSHTTNPLFLYCGFPIIPPNLYKEFIYSTGLYYIMFAHKCYFEEQYKRASSGIFDTWLSIKNN